jgi:hypothetical protein
LRAVVVSIGKCRRGERYSDKLGALLCATLDESFFPSDILQLTAWLVTVDAIHALSTLHPIKVTAGSKRLTVWFKDDAPKYGRC